MNNFTNDSIQITFSQPNLDLFQIADSGQCFRMIPLESEKNGDTKEIPGFSVICSGRYCELYQKGEKITLLCMPQDETFWKNYLDIDTDYGTIIASVDPSDKYLLKAADFGKGYPYSAPGSLGNDHYFHYFSAKSHSPDPAGRGRPVPLLRHSYRQFPQSYILQLS